MRILPYFTIVLLMGAMTGMAAYLLPEDLVMAHSNLNCYICQYYDGELPVHGGRLPPNSECLVFLKSTQTWGDLRKALGFPLVMYISSNNKLIEGGDETPISALGLGKFIQYTRQNNT